MKSFCSSHTQYGMPQWVRLFHVLFYGMCISTSACSRGSIKNNHCYEPYESALASIVIVRDITFHKSWMDYFVKEITSSMIP